MSVVLPTLHPKMPSTLFLVSLPSGDGREPNRERELLGNDGYKRKGLEKGW